MGKIPDIDIHEHLNYCIVAYDDDGEQVFCKEINQKTRIYGGGWVAFYQKSLEHISKLGLTGEQLNVFLALMSKLDFENYIRISQMDLAKKLNIKQPQVSRAIRRLLEEDIICQGPRAGLCKTYILNPNVGIKGKQKRNKLIDYKEAKAARIAEKAKQSGTTDKTKE